MAVIAHNLDVRDPLIPPNFSIFGQLTSQEIRDKLLKVMPLSGYRPLEREKWAFYHKGYRDHRTWSRKTESCNVFFNRVKIQPPGHQGTPKLDEMTWVEAFFYDKLYWDIISGKTAFRFAPGTSLEFQKRVFEEILHLMTRPSGRLIILSAACANISCTFEEGPYSMHNFYKNNVPDPTITICCNYSGNHICEHENKSIMLKLPLFTVIAHEILHFLHLADSQKIFMTPEERAEVNFICNTQYSDNYRTYEELYTIEGFDNLPSENMVLFEFGLPPRKYHRSVDIEPIRELGVHLLSQLPKAGILSRAEICATHNLEDELHALLPYLNNQDIEQLLAFSVAQDALGSVKFICQNRQISPPFLYNLLFIESQRKDRSQIYEFLINYNPTMINYENQVGCTFLHEAAYRGAFEKVKILLDAGANPNLPSICGFNVLHYALISTSDSTAILDYLKQNWIFCFVLPAQQPTKQEFHALAKSFSAHPNNLLFLENNF